MFHCVCHTCEVRTVYEEWADAQEAFNEHACDRHEVVLRRDAPVEEAPTPDSVGETTESKPAAKSVSDGHNPMDG